MLRRKQERIGTELRAVESRRAVIEASLDDLQGVMNLAIRFSTSCARAYRRAGDRNRKLFNTAVLDQAHMRNGHVVEAATRSRSISSSLCRSSNTTMWWALEDSNR